MWGRCLVLSAAVLASSCEQMAENDRKVAAKYQAEAQAEQERSWRLQIERNESVNRLRMSDPFIKACMDQGGVPIFPLRFGMGGEFANLSEIVAMADCKMRPIVFSKEEADGTHH